MSDSKPEKPPATRHSPTHSPLLVDHPAALRRLQHELQAIRKLAVDTESNSLFAYQERVCLIQLSTTRADYIFDPLRLNQPSDLQIVGDLFANPKVEKVFHAAEYDIMTMRRDFGFTFCNIFDTMLAARILGRERVGLSSMLEEQFGVTVNKSQQRANWGKRPMTPEMIRYAQGDTHHLLALRDDLHHALIEADHLEEALEIFEDQVAAQWGGAAFDPQGFWRLNGIRELKGIQLAALQALYAFRDEQARREDVPVFKIMLDEALVGLAAAMPTTLKEMEVIHGMGRNLLARYGIRLQEIIDHARSDPIPKRPHHHHTTDELTQNRFDALIEWRKESAAKRGVSSDIILSKGTLWEIARAVPRTLDDLAALECLGSWRLKTYGEELIAVLNNPQATAP